MRSIKFRAWDKKTRQMSIPLMIKDISVVEFRENWFADMGWVFTELVWLQFTGLKDKLGNEVYEGDILKFNSSLHTLPDKFYEVYWSDGGAWFIKEKAKSRSFDEGERINGFHLYYSEVMGNVYSHPELLK